MNRPAYDPEAALEVLVRHRVRFVVIGGVAVSLQGSALVTQDLDIFPAAAPNNLGRIAEALIELDAHQFHDPDVWTSIDATTLATRRVWEWATIYGKLDLLFEPRGAPTYEAMLARSTRVPLSEGVVRVAAVSDLIRMKEAMGRATDQRALLDLRELQSLMRRRDKSKEK